MAKCIFENLTKKQAKVLAEWYEGGGEQYADPWFEEHDIRAPLVDVARKGGYQKILKNGDVIVYCKE